MQSTGQPSQPSTPETPPPPLEPGFVKVEGNATEQFAETTSLTIAYSAMWLILMLFTLVTWRGHRSLRADADRLAKAVAAKKPTRT
jgi:hypothetical protein